MVHVPAATSVTAAPETVHTADVSDAKVTARPDDDVAFTVNGAVPNTAFESAPNVIVWLVCVT